uniref:Uncharacterized protein n=1 Tax=Oryza glumipatula TaxID=40148 RepID=A0A0E0AAI9_9ORYZ
MGPTCHISPSPLSSHSLPFSLSWGDTEGVKKCTQAHGGRPPECCEEVSEHSQRRWQTDDADTETPSPRSRLYVFIRASLLLSVFFLAANANGHSHVLVASVDLFHSSWVRFRAAYVSPPLQLLADACVVRFLVQSADCLV